MTSSNLERVPFDETSISVFGESDPKHRNWPVVYLLDGDASVYVGETLDAVSRLRQHLANPQKTGFSSVRVVLDETFNKSACLDLEAFLINAFTGDGKYAVTNLNAGIVDREYFDRERYQASFRKIFERLRADGLFDRRLDAIENDDLFKLSPFKALNTDQAVALEGVLEALFDDIETETGGSIVIQGDPGTGKTIVGITLAKLLVDIQRSNAADDVGADGLFADFFREGFAELIAEARIGLVVPQQSLRASIKAVFRKAPGLHADMVVSPFDVGQADSPWDILIVDESHRLNRRANQPSAALNQKFREINEKLFGADDVRYTQLDWIRARSRHQVLMVDPTQRVKPADLSEEQVAGLIADAGREGRLHRLLSQMRVLGGSDYIDFIRGMLDGKRMGVMEFGDYDLRFFDDVSEMRDEIRLRDEEHGLARLAAGFAWEWKTKRNKQAFDIEIDGVRLRWNQTVKDWINSPGSVDEVGSIHTVQGYDLNYAGVIIGPDLRFDPARGTIFVDRASYFDKKGKENNPALGLKFSDDDLREFIKRIYFVLLTRGIRGTYVNVCDPDLREHLRQYFPTGPRVRGEVPPASR